MQNYCEMQRQWFNCYETPPQMFPLTISDILRTSEWYFPKLF